MYNVILFSLIGEFQRVLRIEGEGAFGIVVDIEVHSVAHLRIDAHVDLFVKIKGFRHAAAFRKGGVVHKFVIVAEFQFGLTSGSDLYTAGTEYLFGWSQVEVHVGEVEFLLSFVSEQ